MSATVTITTTTTMAFLFLWLSRLFGLSEAALVSPSTKIYDLVVVGGGSAGLTAAKFGSDTVKKSVLLIEKEKLGGDCTWTGCVPSKSLIASARASAIARKYAATNKVPTFAEIQQKYKSTIEHIYQEDDSPEAMKKFGVDTLQGMATLESENKVVVTNQAENEKYTIVAKEGIVLCTGATPKRPNLEGLDSVDYVTYEEVWDLKELPKQLTIVGGGPIGCELAQAFAKLGSKVTIIARKLSPTSEPEVGDILQNIFEENDGITVVNGKVTSVSKSSDGNIGHTAFVSTSNDETVQVSGDVLLLSVGRKPNVDGMGLKEVGIEINQETAGIQVNEKLQTNIKRIYAAGDCTGDRQFTHYAGFQGAIAARNILLPLSDPGVIDGVISTTFTSPEIASVGRTEEQARNEYGDDLVGVAIKPLETVDRALCDDQTRGIFKIIYNKRKGTIYGATIMAPSAGDMISEIAVAMHAKLPIDELAKVMHPYPSYAIAIQLMAAEIYYEKTKKSMPLYNFLKRLGL